MFTLCQWEQVRAQESRKVAEMISYLWSHSEISTRPFVGSKVVTGIITNCEILPKWKIINNLITFARTLKWINGNLREKSTNFLCSARAYASQFIFIRKKIYEAEWETLWWWIMMRMQFITRIWTVAECFQHYPHILRWNQNRWIIKYEKIALKAAKPSNPRLLLFHRR